MNDARLTAKGTLKWGRGQCVGNRRQAPLIGRTQPVTQKAAGDTFAFSCRGNKHSPRASRASDECDRGDVLGRRQLDQQRMHDRDDTTAEIEANSSGKRQECEENRGAVKARHGISETAVTATRRIDRLRPAFGQGESAASRQSRHIGGVSHTRQILLSLFSLESDTPPKCLDCYDEGVEGLDNRRFVGVSLPNRSHGSFRNAMTCRDVPEVFAGV